MAFQGKSLQHQGIPFVLEHRYQTRDTGGVNGTGLDCFVDLKGDDILKGHRLMSYGTFPGGFNVLGDEPTLVKVTGLLGDHGVLGGIAGDRTNVPGH